MTGSAQNRILVPFDFSHRWLSSNMVISRHFDSITAETSALISTNFCTTIKTKYSSWVTHPEQNLLSMILFIVIQM